MTRAEIIELQTRLTELGYNPGPVDGWYGEQTRNAYRTYLDAQDSTIPSVTPAPQIPWYLSRPVVGILATIIASVAGLFGVVVDSGPIVEVLTQTMALVFAVKALFGTIYQKGEIRGRYAKGAVVSADGGIDDLAQHNAQRLRVELPAGHRAERERETDGWNG